MSSMPHTSAGPAGWVPLMILRSSSTITAGYWASTTFASWTPASSLGFQAQIRTSARSSSARRSPTSSGLTARRTAGSARQDNELLRRPGHRDVPVHSTFDALPERIRVDEHDQIELKPLGQLRCQRSDAGGRLERRFADNAGDSLSV